MSSDPGTQPFQTRVDSWNDLRREFGGLFSMGSRARARDASLNSASLQSVSVRNHDRSDLEMVKRPKANELEMDDNPNWLIERARERERGIDFADLRDEIRQIAIALEPIALPSDEEWKFILYMESIGQKWRNEVPYWWYHDYPSTKDYRARVKEFNKEVERSGIRELAMGATTRKGCPVWVVLNAIQEQRLSSAFIDAWATLNILLGRLFELREFQIQYRKLIGRALYQRSRWLTHGEF